MLICFICFIVYLATCFIDKPTRITKHSTTLIDHIYTNDVKHSFVSDIIIDDLSDHLPIFAISKK